jgi:amidase
MLLPFFRVRSLVGPQLCVLNDDPLSILVIAGPDPNDNFTLAQPTPVPDFTKALNKNALKGKRIGVPRKVFLNDSISGNVRHLYNIC